MAIPLPTLGPTVDATGISIPTYADILGTLQAQYRSIYGSDVYLEADSQDGQWIAIQARAFNDINAACVAVYNQMSPATAVGVGLSSVVKINGIARQIPSNSTVDVVIVGQQGTLISNGIVGDAAGNRWALPALVAIPDDGDITVTATAVVAGDVEAPSNTVTNILTPTRGWQTVNNPTAATPGQPVEQDGQLRIRQAKSVALPALTPISAIEGAVASIPGVARLKYYENDTNLTDADGIPAKSIALIVQGGDAQTIAATILAKKTLGVGTFGSTTEMTPDPYGIPRAIKFSRPDLIGIEVAIELEALSGYTTAVGDQIRQAIADYINALKIGDNVVASRIYTPANLYGRTGSETYEINTLQIKKTGGSYTTGDVVVAFDELANIGVDDIVLTVV